MKCYLVYLILDNTKLQNYLWREGIMEYCGCKCVVESTDVTALFLFFLLSLLFSKPLIFIMK